MRNNKWLEQKLDFLWLSYFQDVPKLNNIHIAFGRSAKRRLASIRQISHKDKTSDTQIKVTGFYKDPTVPEYVVLTTIAHELCHYAHGFASPLPQFSRYPHHGGIVDRELVRRGLGKSLEMQRVWLKDSWHKIVGDNAPLRRRRRVRKTPFSIRKWLAVLSS